MSTRNYHVYNKDVEVLKDYAAQYEQLGRDTKIEDNKLTVYAGKKPVPVARNRRADKNATPEVDSSKPNREQRSKRRE